MEITPEESLINDYVKEVYASERVCTEKMLSRVILDTKYDQADLHEVMETQCQHLKLTERNDLLKLLQRFKEFLDGTIGTWKQLQQTPS